MNHITKLLRSSISPKAGQDVPFGRYTFPRIQNSQSISSVEKQAPTIDLGAHSEQSRKVNNVICCWVVFALPGFRYAFWKDWPDKMSVIILCVTFPAKRRDHMSYVSKLVVEDRLGSLNDHTRWATASYRKFFEKSSFILTHPGRCYRADASNVD